MSSTSVHEHGTGMRTPVASRAGYVAAAVVNVVLLWIVHRLLDWGWPAFLTPRFDDLLPWLTVSFLVSIVVNLWFAYDDTAWRKPLGELVTSAIGVAVGVRTWQVFPFDFSGYDHDWTWAARTLVVVGIVATSIGVVAHGARLVHRLIDPGTG